MEDILNFGYPTLRPSIIKVIGVGGGGGNAVTHMYKEGIEDVTFALCNTDNQALIKSEVPVKIQLGKTITEGLGAGNKPPIAKAAAEESVEDIQKLLNDGTRMVFITAGMGGGTGTGAAPSIAKIAKEMGILTIGIVTIPFLFEGRPKIIQAIRGVEEIRQNVDALLVINNQRLIDIYGNLVVTDAFKKADDTLRIAARSIAEIITTPGEINLDFADVNTTLRNGGVAIMSSGFAVGETRITKAFEDALHSPLLNSNDVFNAKKILFNVYFSSEDPLKVDEMNEITNFMARFDDNIEVIWGTAINEDVEGVKVTILATGFGRKNIPMITELAQEDQLVSEEEERQKEVKRIQQQIKDTQLMNDYYDNQKIRGLGKAIRPKPFIFTLEQMDNNTVIDAIIQNPAYNRDSKAILNVIKEKESPAPENNDSISIPF